ncbi:MAG TPA: DUF4423 domain-containing protein [Bdellovibrio sp.]|nr:DUF4423 domain-containing protein [Bdellovibrio sp.]
MSAGNKIFHFNDYKKFVIQELKQRPHGGRGQFLRIAQALNIHTTMITHIFRGNLHLSSEQTLGLAEYLGLNELETQFLVDLVMLARAGDQRTKKYFEKRILRMRAKALQLSERFEIKNELSEADQATFYSSWLYTTIRLLTAIPKFQTRAAIAEFLNLGQSKVNKLIEFLISRGLVTEKAGKIFYGNVKTYVAQDSPYVVRHHSNWRLKVVEQYDRLTTEELAFTKPVVMSESDFLKVREELVRFIETFNKISEPSPCEKLYCLNIDWVQIK